MKTTVGHNQENTIGKNIKTVAKEEISQDKGKKTIISSGDNTEISARKDLDLHGKKNLIGFTDGKTEFGAKEQMHIYGANSLITAKDKIEYKAPSMNKLPENGKFEFDKEPNIVDFHWMDSQMENQITEIHENGEVKFYIQTRNVEAGEAIKVTFAEIDDLDVRKGEKEVLFSGIVDENGIAELKEVFEIEEVERDYEDSNSSTTSSENSTAQFKDNHDPEYHKLVKKQEDNYKDISKSNFLVEDNDLPIPQKKKKGLFGKLFD